MDQRQVKVGMVGLGLVASSHLKGFESHPRAEVIAVCDLDRGRVERFAETHGIPEVYTSYEEMLQNGSLDAVSIATPNYLHSTMTKQAAEHGKHVHCEKPFCRFVEEGKGAIEAAKRTGVKIAIGETYMFITSFMKARELIDQGEIGRPLQIRERHGAWIERPRTNDNRHMDLVRPPIVPRDRHWRVDPVKSGGGDWPWIFDHAGHFFIAGEYLLQDQKISEVYAVASQDSSALKKAGASHDPYSTTALDIPIITWRYEDPALQGLWIRAERLNGKYDYMQGFSASVFGDKGMVEVLGEGGHNLMWNGQQVHMVLHREGKESITFRFDEGGDEIWDSDISYYSKGHSNQVQHFIDCILQDSEPRASGEHGIRTAQCTLGTIMSAREHRPVKVNEVGHDYTAY